MSADALGGGGPVRQDRLALEELRQLVAALVDELGAFRRRALQAEARVRELEATSAITPSDLERFGVLERDNARLRQRLDEAAEQTRVMLARIRFLRQQTTGDGR